MNVCREMDSSFSLFHGKWKLCIQPALSHSTSCDYNEILITGMSEQHLALCCAVGRAGLREVWGGPVGTWSPAIPAIPATPLVTCSWSWRTKPQHTEQSQTMLFIFICDSWFVTWCQGAPGRSTWQMPRSYVPWFPSPAKVLPG